MRNNFDIKHYQEELEFIKTINPNNPGNSFNNDHDCFERYVNMQAQFALEDGFEELLEGMLNCIRKENNNEK